LALKSWVFFAFIRVGRKAKNSSESQISTRLYQCNQPWFTDATVQFIPPAAANKYRSGQQVGNNVGWQCLIDFSY
jgi:hypothetical protein